MNFLKNTLYQAAGALLKLSLVLLPIAFAISLILASPKPVEKALEESGVYTQIVSSAIDSSQKEQTDPTAKSLLEDPEFKTIAQKTFSPGLLQSSSENIINGLFAWMQGKTTEPEFKIDLSAAKNDLATNVAAYAEKRANSLPACTLQQLRQLNPDTDLLSLPCLPPGANVKALSAQYSQQFLNNDDFLSDPVITNKDLPKNKEGKSFTEQASFVPSAYKAVNVGKWILSVFAIGLAVLLIFIRRNRLAGVKHVAWALIGSGAFLAISVAVYWYMFDRANTLKGIENAIQAGLVRGVLSLVNSFASILFWFAFGYLVVGVGTLLFLRFRPKRTVVAEAPSTESKINPTAPVESNTLDTDKPL